MTSNINRVQASMRAYDFARFYDDVGIIEAARRLAKEFAAWTLTGNCPYSFSAGQVLDVSVRWHDGKKFVCSSLQIKVEFTATCLNPRQDTKEWEEKNQD